MAGASNDVVFRRPWQSEPHRFIVPGVRLVAVFGGTPKLNRDMDVLQSRAAKGETPCRGGDDHCLYARLLLPCTAWNIGAEVQVDVGMPEVLARLMIRVSPAIGLGLIKVRHAARSNQNGEPAVGETKRADKPGATHLPKR
jgi:hypothetical protein